MPATSKAPAKKATAKRAAAKKAPAKKASVGDSLRTHIEENDRVLGRIAESLEVAQADLGKLRGSVGTGVNELRRDLSKLLRDASRDVTRLGKSTRKDLERLQKDMVAAARPKSNGAGKAKARVSKATSKR